MPETYYGYYKLEGSGHVIEPMDEDGQILLETEDESIYFTKKDIKHMLTMLKKEKK